MQWARDHRGIRKRAGPGELASCPGCGKPVTAQCGQIYRPHWQHVSCKDCDTWYEPESEWHLGFKDRFLDPFQEVTIGPHRADVHLPGGLTIELQNSPLGVVEIFEREKFYGNMIWIVNANLFFDNLEYFPTREPSQERPATPVLVPEALSGERLFNHFLQEPLRPQPPPCEGYVGESRDVGWKHPRKSWFYARAPLYFDTPVGLYRVTLQDDAFNRREQRSRGYKIRDHTAQHTTFPMILKEHGVSENVLATRLPQAPL